MKSFVLAMLICQTLQMMAQAPPAAPAQSASVAPAGLPSKDLAIAGSTIQAELTRPIDARKNKMGDEVVLKTTQDVNWNGHIVLPKGSKLIGHLTELKVRSKDHGTSELRIAFDRAILKDRTEMPLSLTIQAIGRATIAGEDDLASGSPTVAPGGLLGGIGSPSAGGSASTLGAAPPSVLSSTSQGVVGLRGLTLSKEASASASTRGSVISSNYGNVHLDSGTEMVLRVNP